MKTQALWLIALICLTSSVSRAGTVRTPPLTRSCSEVDEHNFSCVVVNDGKNEIEATIELVGGSSTASAAGFVFASTTQQVPVGSVKFVSHSCSSADLPVPPKVGYCRVSGRGVTRRSVRVTMMAIPRPNPNCIYVNAVSYCSAVTSR